MAKVIESNPKSVSYHYLEVFGTLGQGDGASPHPGLEEHQLLSLFWGPIHIFLQQIKLQSHCLATARTHHLMW